jgi:hypothetical protein
VIATSTYRVTCLARCLFCDHDRDVAVGWVLAGLGLLALAFPGPIMAAARGWRIGMPRADEPGAVRTARIGAMVAVIAGVVIALA